jgi:hypothetical protein
MESEFVDPRVERLHLSGVDRWIDVKHELNAGESRALFTDLVKEMRHGEAAVLDPHKVGVTKVLAFLLGWSFTDGNGRPIPVSPSAVDNLKPATYVEIREAIDAHEERVEAERTARKNGQATGNSSSPIARSPEPLVGATNG